MAISITQLSKYLSGRDFGPSMDITWSEGEIDEQLPWNGISCLSVVSYAIKFCSGDDDDDIDLSNTIRRLNDVAAEVNKAIGEDWEITEREYEFAEIFVNMLMPKVEKFFSPPERNEHLFDFIHFLLQILNSELYHIQQMSPLPLQQGLRSVQEGLSFLLAVLGDAPFQYAAEVEEVKDLLVESKGLAKEAGSFIYSFVFRTVPVDLIKLHETSDLLQEKVDLLNKMIKEHCIRFPEIPLLTPVANPSSSSTAVSMFMVNSLIEDLENLLSGSSIPLIDDIKDQATKLRVKLLCARSLLKDTNGPWETEFRESKEWVIKIRDTTYEADYLINSFVVGTLPDWYLSLRLPIVIQRFNHVLEGLNSIWPIHLSSSSEVKEERTVLEDDVVLPSTVDDDDTLVGFEKEMEQILYQLTQSSGTGRTTISIIGPSGIGKSTLAKKIYNTHLITQYFDARAWSVVSRVYVRRMVLMDIVMSLGEMQDSDKDMNMEDWNIGEVIFKSLYGRRYLIVLDDVWSSEAWDDLRRFLPDNSNGSRILITSRIQDVVRSSFVCELPLLSEDQCWELLEKMVFGDKPCPQQLHGHGQRIVAKCNGLPLIVASIAGILANMPEKLSLWETVEKDIDRYNGDHTKTLELSYNHLPNHLKLCFLYFGAFAADREIPVKKLTRLWMAEGFIMNDHRGFRSAEEAATEYLNDLIERNLVLVAKRRSTGRVKSCSIHDLLRNLSLRIAKEENFIKVFEVEHKSSDGRHHRLAVPFTVPAQVRPFSTHCRSYFGHLSDPSSCLPQMKHMRVMDLLPNENLNISYVLKRMNMLVQLRYLVVDRMPESIAGNLANLETLIVETMSIDVNVPADILNLSKLRDLCIKREAKFRGELDTSQPNNLLSLSNLSIYSTDDYRVLTTSPHLRKLKCTLSPKLSHFDFPNYLESLSIAVPHTSVIPKSIYIDFPQAIKKLTLSWTRLPWEIMYIVAELPKLEVLKLDWKAFAGKKWETRDNGFAELKFLKLVGLQLEQWSTSDDHFPSLKHLVLHKCEKLRNIPNELGYVATLKKIEVHDCSYEASESAADIGLEQSNYGNDIEVVITQGGRREQFTRPPLSLW